MRYRPLFTSERFTLFPNKLFHPVKLELEIEKYMTINMTKNTEDSFFLLNNKMLSSIDKAFLGLANGKMGLCIYFYHLARLKAQPKYEKTAEILLEEIINNISLETSINVEVGLAGIGIGIRHLIKEQYISGDSNEILEEIDNEIYKKIVFEGGDTSTIFLSEMIHILFYLYVCYSEQTKDSQKYIYSELIIKTIEIIYQRFTPDFWDEPLSFTINYHLPRFLFIISKIISLNIYNRRLYRILDEFKIKFLGVLPCSHGNRLFLLWGLVYLNNAHQNPDIKNQINILKTHIDLSRILNIELSENQIFLHNGVSLICFLLLNLNKADLANSIEFDSSVLYNRIINAAIWNNLGFEDYHYGLLNGIPGPIWALSLLKK